MTNGEYYRMTLTDREIAGFCSDIDFTKKNRLEKAFDKWIESLDCGSTHSNTTQYGRVNIWAWSRIHNHITDKWETKRTHSVRFQQFLALPYKKEYWG